MRISKSLTATGDALFSFDHYQNPGAARLQVNLSGGTATYTAYETLDDPADFASQAAFVSGAQWTAITGMSGVSASGLAALSSPANYVRVNVSAISGATVKCTFVQAGPRPG
jgi:hypothetical protein